MKFVRLPDLAVSFQPDAMLMLRSAGSGVGARVPLPAIGVLAFCGVPREEAEIAAAMGETAVALFRGLREAGVLVPPDRARHTPVYFSNYSGLDIHRRMLADFPRVDAYARALRERVRPGMAVLDAGTGSGILACLAALAGARIVYAVDRSELLDLAKDVAARSGLDERIRFVRGDFSDVELPEPVDLIVSETIGALVYVEGSNPDLLACARRHLKPGGHVIPDGVDLFLAPVRDRALFDDAVGTFGNLRGVDLSPLAELALHQGRGRDLVPDQLLAPGTLWFSLPHPTDRPAEGRVRFDDLPAGTFAGLAGWFTLKLSESVSMPSSPADPPTHWGQAYLPIPPFETAGGETLQVEARIEAAGDDRRAMEVTGAWTLGDRAGQLLHRIR